MKLRSALLVLVALLLVAGVAGASPNPADSSTTAPAVSAAASFTMDASACGSSDSTPGAAIFTPAPSERALTCGSCSLSPCVGATYNAVCGFRGGLAGHCLSPLGDRCTSGGWACQCWYGPLP